MHLKQYQLKYPLHINFTQNHDAVIYSFWFISVDQVRSFSSIEHNEDGFFQYFALDFNEASSAFHGSDILTQAGEQ